jgi:peptide/nickel transport system permease protein
MDAIMNRDYNVIMGIQLISVVLTLIGLIISDISYALVDPRITFK